MVIEFHHRHVLERDGDTERNRDLDDERKVRKRRRRRERIPAALKTIRDGPRHAALLLDLAIEETSEDARHELLSAARAVNFHAGAAKAELFRYRLVPPDADQACRCGADTTLPSFLDAQAIQAPDA